MLLAITFAVVLLFVYRAALFVAQQAREARFRLMLKTAKAGAQPDKTDTVTTSDAELAKM